MRADLEISGFHCGAEPRTISFNVRTPRPLPAPFAGSLDFYNSDNTHLAATELVIPQGGTENSGILLPIDPVKRESPRDISLAAWWARVKKGERVAVRARLTGKKEVAAGSQGFDSYWSGSLDFKETAGER
jgi:hypothetical protein